MVEAVDRAARREGRPDVVGEALVDATASTHHEPLQEGLVALHGGRLAHRIGPDHGTRRELLPHRPRPLPHGAARAALIRPARVVLRERARDRPGRRR